MEYNKEICFLAKTNYRNKQQVFGIKRDDRRRHMYIIGKTGMGKTTIIQNMAIQDVRNGHGLGIIDPHGEFAQDTLMAVPESRIKDVVYFNPSDLDYPIAMNVLESVDPDRQHLVASGLVSVFKKMWADSWGPRLEYLLRNAIMALLETENATILGINRVFIDKNYQKTVVNQIKNPIVRTFFVDEIGKWQDKMLQEAVAPIQNKVGQFLSNSMVRNILGQEKSSFDVRKAMDEQKIVIMNFSKGLMGEDNSTLLGAMMVTKLQIEAMGRVNIEESERKDFYLYVDEFQNFATDSFATILSEARKYRLCLILAHQYIAQLPEVVRDAVFGNVGTMACFRVGTLDTDILEKEFFPVFEANDLLNLEKFNIYLKLMVDGVASTPFSASTLYPIELDSTAKNAESLIEFSRKTYGRPKETVEKDINIWLGVQSPEVSNKIASFANSNNQDDFKKKDDNQNVSKHQQSFSNFKNNSNNEKGDRNNSASKNVSTNEGKNFDKKNQSLGSSEKEMFNVDCSGCGANIQIPFKPDGKRPVFCKECLKEYRRAQAKNQPKSNTPTGQKKDNSSELKDLINNAMKKR